jgi:hypothetical protein
MKGYIWGTLALMYLMAVHAYLIQSDREHNRLQLELQMARVNLMRQMQVSARVEPQEVISSTVRARGGIFADYPAPGNEPLPYQLPRRFFPDDTREQIVIRNYRMAKYQLWRYCTGK